MAWIYAFIFPLVAVWLINLLTKNRFQRAGLILILVYIPLAVFIGVRDGVGRDYYSYVNDFYNINELGLFYVEPGFWYLNRLSWLLGAGPTGVFLLSSFISYTLIAWRSTAETTNQVATLTALFGVGYVIFSLSGVRQALAIAIFFYGMRYIWEGRFINYIFTILIGAMFHASIIFTAPFYFLLRKRLPVPILWLLLFSSIYAALSPKSYLSSLSNLLSFDAFVQYKVYGERIVDVEVGPNTGFGLIAYLAVMLIILLFDSSIRANSNLKDRVLSYSVFFGFCGFMFFSAVSDLSRLFNYFVISALLWHPNFIYHIRDRNMKMTLNFTLIVIWMVLYLYPVITQPRILEPNLMHYR